MVEVVDKIEVRELDETVVLEEGDCAVDVPQELDEMGKVLLKARDYIREHGWCQNDMGQLGGNVCLLGAIQVAQGKEPRSVSVKDLFGPGHPIAVRLGFDTGMRAASWNDVTDRTQQEVEERLERAAYNL